MSGIARYSFVLLIIAVLCLSTACMNNDGDEFIKEKEAIEIAKQMDRTEGLVWTAQLERNKELNLNNQTEVYDIWIVSAVYPAGNEIVIQIHAKTGQVISLTEIEANW